MRNGCLWRDGVFEKKSNCPQIWFLNLRFRIWSLKIKHLKAHNFVWPWCDDVTRVFFSFISISQLRWPIELKKLQVCYFMHVEIHQLWRLVFDNYQQCPVSLTNFLKIIKHYWLPKKIPFYIVKFLLKVCKSFSITLPKTPY